MEKWRLIEYRTCHGLQRFVRVADGSLLPESLWRLFLDRANAGTEGPPTLTVETAMSVSARCTN